MECNEEYKYELNSKFEECKPQDDQRSLLSTLKMLKSVHYIFEVDGKQKINVGESLMSSAQNSLLAKKYQQLNEVNIEENLQRMMTPLTHYIANKGHPLNEKALAGLPSKKLISSSVPSSLRSESTYMSSQLSHKSETSSTGVLSLDEMNSEIGSVSSVKNMKISFSEDPDLDNVVVGVCAESTESKLPTPPVAMNRWQRKHNNFVMNAMRMQQQLQQQ